MIQKMGPITPELSLDFNKPTYVPRTVKEFLRELSAIADLPERRARADDFMTRLEEEMRKIEAFKRELPLCMLLLHDVISYLDETTRFRTRKVQPVLEEFIPIKKKNCDEDEECDTKKEKDNSNKMNWLRSVQLWNADASNNNIEKRNSQDKQRNHGDNHRVMNDPLQSCKTRIDGSLLVPANGYPIFTVKAPSSKEENGKLAVPGLFLTPGIKIPREELCSIGLISKISDSREAFSSIPNGQSNAATTARKQRRCWSQDLHRRFVNALQQLGGSHAATPKQIRELMQVDGLTNDEVKSHLQKYRLHFKRVPSDTTTPPAGKQPLVDLGGLWDAPDQCGESSKASNSQSDSPQGPLHLTCGGTSTTGGDSMEEEDEEKSESYCWKSHAHRSGKVDV